MLNLKGFSVRTVRLFFILLNIMIHLILELDLREIIPGSRSMENWKTLLWNWDRQFWPMPPILTCWLHPWCLIICRCLLIRFDWQVWITRCGFMKTSRWMIGFCMRSKVLTQALQEGSVQERCIPEMADWLLQWPRKDWSDNSRFTFLYHKIICAKLSDLCAFVVNQNLSTFSIVFY